MSGKEYVTLFHSWIYLNVRSSSLQPSSVTSYHDNLDDDDLQPQEKSMQCVPGEKNKEEAVHDFDLLRFVVQPHFLT